uniref:Uncharacterized protein n=1 Tax=Arundo donax TaxID=35708 RepID=A0A0A9GU80_ARUDO
MLAPDHTMMILSSSMFCSPGIKLKH